MRGITSTSKCVQLMMVGIGTGFDIVHIRINMNSDVLESVHYRQCSEIKVT